ncbi:hypothetical protein X975_25502, partial [Stegodyphus mimosarum]
MMAENTVFVLPDTRRKTEHVRKDTVFIKAAMVELAKWLKMRKYVLVQKALLLLGNFAKEINALRAIARAERAEKRQRILWNASVLQDLSLMMILASRVSVDFELAMEEGVS